MSDATDIKTVIFDLGGVYFTDGAKSFVQKMTKLFGIPEVSVIEIISGDLGKAYRTSEISPKIFWECAKQSWNLDIETEELSRLWLEEYLPIEGTELLIERLTQANYEVLFLSDNAADRVDYLESRYTFLSRFKVGVFSHIVNARKPDEKIYKAVLDIASYPASQCVYIDDKPELLIPAQKLGMATIAFQSPKQVESELKEFGLAF